MKSHIFYNNNYNNNTGFFHENGVVIKGVRFHDFSYMYKDVKAVNGPIISTLSEAAVTPTSAQIQQALTDYANGRSNIDHMNKIYSMMWTNWNGAEITKGDFATGENYLISDTPEFLSIFNAISTAVYDEIIYKNTFIDRIKRQKAITKTVNATAAVTSVGKVIDNKEIINVIYVNSTANEVFLTIENNITVTDNNTCKFKVPNGTQLAITVQPYGFGEISYLRYDNTIYARGI
jgi:hypothetical protein